MHEMRHGFLRFNEEFEGIFKGLRLSVRQMVQGACQTAQNVKLSVE